MNEKFKKYILFYLQLCYNDISDKLKNLETHLNNLNYLHFIDNNKFNNKMNILYILLKNLNNEYNIEINNKIEKYDNELEYLVKYVNNNENVILQIKSYYNNYPNKLNFIELRKEIKLLIKDVGYINIKDLLKEIFNFNLFNNLDLEIKTLINEIENIVIPLNYNIFDVSNETKTFYWRNNKNYLNDNLQKIRDLWIKIPNNKNKYLKIELVFKLDKLSSILKTCQIVRPVLYKKKIHIINKVNENSNLNLKFVKTLIRYDYLGNIYTMNTDDYVKYIVDLYFKYTKLIDSTFITLMKEFISYSENIKKMYDIIFLLLLGTDDTVDIACLLLGLLKEKKNKFQLYSFIYDNLPFYLQLKIKKSNTHIKNNIDKIKNSNFEDVDYKKLLVINKNIPDYVKSLVMEKIEEMKTFNNEYYKQLTFVKTILHYPWTSPNDDIFFNNLNKDKIKSKEYLQKIEHNLKNLCFGHNNAKQSLLQIIGKWISNPSGQGTCLGFVGPPGVGKTLLAKSVSDALDIPFRQITLGGQNDGEILHGHGYTYSGAQPGMIIKKMVEMGKSRCILYFDELDKACSKHGNINEITSILIHLTDPNMNKNFQDRFFQGIDFPLNKLIIIFSYNDSSLIDPILLDRIKEINVSPYTLDDKINICKNFIIPETKEDIKLDKEIIVNDNILEFLINNYTSEAGVRGIKRKLEEIFLKLNLDKIFCKDLFLKNESINLTKKIITDILSKPKINRVCIYDKSNVGIINGLYATTTGEGGIIPIQIYSNLHNTSDNFEIKLTGKQGDVMKESVMCSLTSAVDYLKRNHNKYGIENFDSYFQSKFKNGFHVHCPSTSTPKDGPSAGCAFTSGFISRILDKKIKNDIGMTGEIDLNGNITKIGGLEFKLYGAKLAGINTVFVPEENKDDYTEIKKKYKNIFTKKFSVKLFSKIDDIIDEILI